MLLIANPILDYSHTIQGFFPKGEFNRYSQTSHSPQDVVEERVNVEYGIALSSAGALVLVIAFVAVALMVMRCRNKRRESSRRRQQQQQQKRGSSGNGSIIVEVGSSSSSKQQPQRMLRSKSGGEVSVADSVSTQVRSVFQFVYVYDTVYGQRTE